MADFVTKTGLGYFYDRLKTVLATKDELNALDDRVDDIVSEGGEQNKINAIKVNGSELTPDSNKAVNINVPTSTQALTNNGDGTSPFATESYVNTNGGKIDKIKINGTEQAITNKTVDITVPESVSDISNDLNFQTDTEVAAQIAASISSAYKAKGSIAFSSLPALTAANQGNVYNITDSFTTTSNFVEGAGKSYPAGTNVVIINTSGSTYKYDVLSGFVDLSGYWKKADLVAVTTAEIDSIING